MRPRGGGKSNRALLTAEKRPRHCSLFVERKEGPAPRCLDEKEQKKKTYAIPPASSEEEKALPARRCRKRKARFLRREEGKRWYFGYQGERGRKRA